MTNNQLSPDERRTATRLLAQVGRYLPNRRVVSHVVTASWVFQFVALIGTIAWVFSDAQFPYAARIAIDGAFPPYLIGARSLAEFDTYLRVRSLQVLFVLIAVTLLVTIIGLVIGKRTQRSIRAWFVAIALTAAWLTLLSTWSNLAWAGQCWRLKPEIAQFEPVADKLRAHWPTQDGELKSVGTYMAYPSLHPRMLMILTPPISQNCEPFCSVERSPAGALRFELSGGESGAWVEWHPVGDEPASYVGGLAVEYQLARSEPVGNGWFVTRYNTRRFVRTGGE